MIAIDDILTPFTSRIHSHRSSWPRTQWCTLRSWGQQAVLAFGDNEVIRKADEWWISHGMEFKNNYNLNGGWLPEHAERLRLMIEKGHDNIVSLERPMPDLVGLLRPRAEKTDHDLTPSEWWEIQQIVDNARVISQKRLVANTERVVLGDSHSVARYRPGSYLMRNDGLTLHGLLTRGIKSYLDEEDLGFIDTLVIQAGNIDIRHHLMRQPDPKASVNKLMADLWTQLEDLKDRGYIGDYEVTAPYPIEHEQRKLPKTGYYKGTPFFGSREEREALRDFMTDEMLMRFTNVKEWPAHWFELPPHEYAEIHMERPRSVHLSPASYEWDLEKNGANKWHK